MGFKVSLKSFGRFAFEECGIGFYYPWFVLIRVDTTAIVVLLYATFDIIGKTDIPVFAIERFQ